MTRGPGDSGVPAVPAADLRAGTGRTGGASGRIHAGRRNIDDGDPDGCRSARDAELLRRAQLLGMRVELAQANNSSLDLAVISDSRGDLGDLYNRLRRAIQRWRVDACTEHSWEITFSQMALHGV